MKIAVNTRFLMDKYMEGLGRYTYEICKRLVERYPQHEFLFLFDRPYQEHFIFGKNVTPIIIPPPARHPLLWYLWFEWSIPRTFRQHQPDLFFSPDGYLSLNTAVPTVIVLHDLSYLHFPDHLPRLARWYYQHYIPRFAKRAEKILTVSKFSKKDIVQNLGIKPEKVEVTYNGASAFYHPVPAEIQQQIRMQYAEGQEFFFYLGAVQPRKNVHHLITAFDRFKKRTKASTKLLIGGRFAWRTGPIKAAYEAAKAKEDIMFLGYLDNEKAAQLMGAALALTYVSKFEGFGVPILEAMQAEIPIITSTISSMPEIAGKAGLLADPTIPDQIANAMQQIHADDNLRAQLIHAGKIQREQFTWEKATDVVAKNLGL